MEDTESHPFDTSGVGSPSAPRKRVDWWLVGICSSRGFSQVIFMTYAAAIPVLQTEWGMTAIGAGTISSGFQLGHACSMFVMSFLADRWGPRAVFVWSLSSAAALSILFAAFARDYASGLVLNTLLAITLAGNYTTGLMILADRYPIHKRGKATGFYVASSSFGYVISLLLSGWSIPVGGYRLSFATASCCCVAGCVCAWVSLKKGSKTRVFKAEPRQRQSLRTEVLARKPVLYLMGVYILHSWEILGMWAWTPAFLAATFALRGFDGPSAAGFGSYATAAFHVAGLFASSLMGGLSDRFGRGVMIMLSSGMSALCSFVFGWSMGLPFIIVLVIGLIYAFFAIGDSPVLSAAMTEVTPAPFLGRAFGIRSLAGFGAGAVSPVVFGAVLDWLGSPGSAGQSAWGWAFGTLGLAGFGAFCISFGLNRALRKKKI